MRRRLPQGRQPAAEQPVQNKAHHPQREQQALISSAAIPLCVVVSKEEADPP